jgi:hypothetical protein
MSPQEDAIVPTHEAASPPTPLGRLRSSSLALIAANLAPLYGVLALGWKVAPILVFYWTENLVIGFFNVLKMARAQGDVSRSRTTLNGRPVTMESRRSMIFFFIVHYGGFTLGHGVFVWAMFRPQTRNLPGEMGLGLLVLFVSHAYSYRHNFIGHGEYLRVPFTTLFWQPYVRVFIMHITILMGGAMASRLGSSLGVLLVLVALKTMIDLVSHWLEHRKFGRSTARQEAA